MPSATLTSKGQITLPKELRDDLRLETGSQVWFVKLDNGQYRLVPRTGTIEDLFNLFAGRKVEPATDEQIEQSIGEYLGEEDARTKSNAS